MIKGWIDFIRVSGDIPDFVILTRDDVTIDVILFITAWQSPLF